MLSLQTTDLGLIPSEYHFVIRKSVTTFSNATIKLHANVSVAPVFCVLMGVFWSWENDTEVRIEGTFKCHANTVKGNNQISLKDAQISF